MPPLFAGSIIPGSWPDIRLAGREIASWAEEWFAVAAAEQEDEPLQVAKQLVKAVGRVASELCQPVRNCSVSASPAASAVARTRRWAATCAPIIVCTARARSLLSSVPSAANAARCAANANRASCSGTHGLHAGAARLRDGLAACSSSLLRGREWAIPGVGTPGALGSQA